MAEAVPRTVQPGSAAPAWKAGRLSGSSSSWAPTFASQEKGLGQRRQYCLSCCEAGVCCMQQVQVLCFILLLKSTDCCVPSPLSSEFCFPQALGSCKCFFLGPSCLLCQPLQGTSVERMVEVSLPPWLPPAHREGSAQHLYCEVLSQQEPAHEMP